MRMSIFVEIAIGYPDADRPSLDMIFLPIKLPPRAITSPACLTHPKVHGNFEDAAMVHVVLV
jgi:hypothetical protein